MGSEPALGASGDAERATDGRTARRDRNRDAVIAAVLAAFAEGEAFPTIRSIADRSGVSLRSVHRYFDDSDEVVCAAIDAFLEHHRETVELRPPPPDTPFEARVSAWIEYRINDSLVSSRSFVGAVARANQSPRIAARIEAIRQTYVDALADLFAPELDALPEPQRRARLAAAHSVTLAEVWYNLAVRHRLTPADIAPAWERALRTALTGPELP
jgi:TetR/AcrR family transcriptional regulator, regulator of autoinduction and epiphytic fitness